MNIIFILNFSSYSINKTISKELQTVITSEATEESERIAVVPKSTLSGYRKVGVPLCIILFKIISQIVNNSDTMHKSAPELL